jgi:uncharacterized protein YeaO (DUF488 family)
MVKTKRVYEKADASDGLRVLVDRLWPRGVSKEQAQIDHWMKDIAPSDNLRKWFSHRQGVWREFKRRYFEELKSRRDLVEQLKDVEKKNKTVTLLYAAKVCVLPSREAIPIEKSY